MLDIRPLIFDDYIACAGQVQPWVDVSKLLAHGWSLRNHRHLVGCGGVVPYWTGVAEAWTLLAPTYEGGDLMTAVRVIRARLAGLPYRRIQADVKAEHMQWPRVLGFELESRMEKYGPDGADYYRYVRIR